MNKYLSITILCCLLLPVAAVSADRDEGRQYIALAHVFAHETDSAKALAQAQSFLRRFPDSRYAPRVHYLSAVALGDTPQAIAQFNAVNASYAARRRYGQLDRDSDGNSIAVASLYKIAEIHYRNRRFAEALDAFTAVTTQYPDSILEGEALCGVAQSHLAVGQWAPAQAALEKLAAVRPDYLTDERVQHAGGLILFNTGDYEKAYEKFKHVNSPDGLYYQGKCLEKTKRYLQAIVAYRRLLSEYPEAKVTEEVQFAIADCYYRAADYDVALAGYRDFLTASPTSHLRELASYQIGCCLAQKKDHAAAIAALNGLIASYPAGAQAPRARMLIAEIQRETGDYAQAAASFKTLIQTYPSHALVPRAWYRLAWLSFEQQRYDDAITTCTALLERYPEHPLASDTLLVAAECQRRAGRPDAAVRACEQVVWNTSGSPENVEAALYLMTTICNRQKQFNDTISAYHYALNAMTYESPVFRPFTLLRVAEAYYYLGMYPEAKMIYDSVLDRYAFSRASPMAIDGKAWVHFQMNDYDLARRERESLLDAVTVGVSTASRMTSEFEMGNISFNNKDYSAALDYYESFIRKYPDNELVPEALFYAGRSNYKLEYYSKAIEQWEQLAGGYPDHPRRKEVLGIIADTYFRAQKYPQAIAAYQRVIKDYPGTPLAKQAHLRVAQSYYNSNDNRQAIAEYDSFIRAYRDDPLALEALEGVIMASYKLGKASADDETDIQVMQSFIAQYPGTTFAAEVQYRLGERLYEKKDYPRAAAAFTDAYSNKYTGAKSADALYYSAESLYLSANYEKAANAFRRFIDNFPSHSAVPMAYLHLANAHYYLKKYDDASQVYLALAALPGIERDMAETALLNAAVCARKMEQWDRVITVNGTFIERYADSPKAKDVRLDTAETYESLARPAQAIEAYKSLIQSLAADDPLVLELRYRVGLLQFKASAPDLGIAELLQLVAARPEDNTWRLAGLLRLGQEYENRQEWAAARQMYWKVIAARPEKKWDAAARERLAAVDEISKADASAGGGAGAVERK